MNISHEQVVAYVNEILSDDFEIPAADIRPDSSLRDDLELDSLDAVDMIVALDKKIGIRVDDEEAAKIQTVGDVYAFVWDLVQKTDKSQEAV